MHKDYIDVNDINMTTNHNGSLPFYIVIGYLVKWARIINNSYNYKQNNSCAYYN